MAYLLKTRPMVFWSGVWTSIFLVSLVAVGCLLSPSASSNRTASEIASDANDEPAVETVPSPHREGQAPIWMFGAIALTCTAGSLLVARCLKLSPPTGAKGKRMSNALKPALRPDALSQPGYPEPVSQTSRQLQPFSPTAPPPFPVLPTFVQSSPKSVVLTSADQKVDQKVTEPQTRQAQTLDDLIAWLNTELDQPPYSLANPLDPFTAAVGSVSQPTLTGVSANASHSLNQDDDRVANPANLHRLRSLQAWLANS